MNKTSIKRNILTIKQNTSGSRSGEGLNSTPLYVIWIHRATGNRGTRGKFVTLIALWRFHDDIGLQHPLSHRCGPTGQAPLHVRVTPSSGAVIIRKSVGYFKKLQDSRNSDNRKALGQTSCPLHSTREIRARWSKSLRCTTAQ